MKIVLDVFGGDNAPEEILNGALEALSKDNDFELVLCGKPDIINDFIEKNITYKARLSVLPADDIITNDEDAVSAIRNKTDSTIVKAYDYMNSDSEAKAFVSAGSTGAVLSGAVLLLRRIKGINRPALAPLLPTQKDKSVLLVDCGANTEPKAINLLQFAKMGSAYMKSMYGVVAPKIGLLSNGTEDKKGNTLTKEALQLLYSATNLNFAGNMEAREILSGDYDVVVSDGFSGNIALKSCEGTALTMFSLIKKGIYNGGLRAKLGYLLLKPVFKDLKHKLDYNDNGGAVLMGLEKIVVKSHGSSKAKAVCNSILQAKNLVECRLVERIREELSAE